MWELNSKTVETSRHVVRHARREPLHHVVRKHQPLAGEMMIEKNVKQAGMQISMVAEIDGRVVGFGLGTLYYGAYGIMEPSASIEAIGVDPEARRQHVAQSLMRQLRMQLRATDCRKKSGGTATDHRDM